MDTFTAQEDCSVRCQDSEPTSVLLICMQNVIQRAQTGLISC